MEFIPKNSVLEFNPDTLQSLRKQYDLDKTDRLEEAITILIEWLKKQDHFVRKNYPKDYLERTIIMCKGSVERAKTKLEKLATFRTLYPQFFEPLPNVKSIPFLNDLLFILLPKMTSDNYRVILGKNAYKHNNTGLMDWYRYAVMTFEYQHAHDYCNGVVAVYDYRESNISEFVKSLNIVELHNAMKIIMSCYVLRSKAAHFITSSNTINLYLNLVKQFVSAKISSRIFVHKSLDSVYKYIPRELFPSDYGGQEKTISELDSDFKDELTSDTFMDYLKEMKNACTDEKYRLGDKFNDDMGIPGSFRKLTVD